MAANTNDFPAILPRAQHKVLKWYERFGRHSLPWRTTCDPYAIYISEIMLQQTQVKTVLERYYEPFLKRFPTLAALAKANVQDVVKQWEGLGYYTRARNLHKAAQTCGGLLPSTPEALMALPGIGRNTAHAVASFAYGLPVPVMEANVRRVLCRVFAFESIHEPVLWEKAHLLLDTKHPFEFNQAMMDIGALICTRRHPKCPECPLAEICVGKKNPEAYPAARKAKQVPIRKRTIVVFYNAAGAFYLMRRDTRFLGGLYGFMEYDANAERVSFLGKRYSLKPDYLLGALTQVYSHFRLEALVYALKLVTDAEMKDGMVKASLADLAALPLSKADHKVLRLLCEQEVSRSNFINV